MKTGVDCIGVSVVYFCHDGKGNFIMAKRSANVRDEKGRWDIGGGAVEFSEGVEETVKKEVKEEYSTDVVSMEFLGFRDVHRINEGKETHWIALDFKVLVNPDSVKIGEPHKFDDLKWCRLDDYHFQDSEVHSQLPTFLKKYQGRL